MADFTELTTIENGVITGEVISEFSLDDFINNSQNGGQLVILPTREQQDSIRIEVCQEVEPPEIVEEGAGTTTNSSKDIVFDLIEQKLKEEQTKPNDSTGAKILSALDGFGSSTMMKGSDIDMNNVRLRIIEQPAPNDLRFRYECEGRNAGSLHGANNNSKGTKTYPTVCIEGYKGPAVILVSCVEHEEPYRAHPHNLVGKHCQKGVCKMNVDPDTMTATFSSLGIQCVRKKDVAASLTQRKHIHVDPFKNQFSHISSTTFNLNKIRLAFQAFLTIRDPPLVVPPVVSEEVKDGKHFRDLKIVDISENKSPVEGGKKILIFTERISRDDIEIRFDYTDEYGNKQPPLLGSFLPGNVHKQFGVAFTTPPFTNQNINRIITTQLYLYKPSDGEYSEPIDFFYEPKMELKTQIKIESAPSPLEQKVPSLMPVYPAPPKPQIKRTRDQRRQPGQQESTQEIKPKYPGSGGNVIVEPVRTEHKTPMYKQIISGDDLNALIKNESLVPSGPLLDLPTDELAGELPASSDLDPNFFFQDNSTPSRPVVDLDSLSGEMLGMALDGSPQPGPPLNDSNHAQRYITRQTSQLETPDVSMDTSKGRNNLDM